jgi:hypothetical protein
MRRNQTRENADRARGIAQLQVHDRERLQRVTVVDDDLRGAVERASRIGEAPFADRERGGNHPAVIQCVAIAALRNLALVLLQRPVRRGDLRLQRRDRILRFRLRGGDRR